MAFDPLTAAFELGAAACKALEAGFLMQKAKYEKMSAAQVQQEAQNQLDFWQPLLDMLKDAGAALRKLGKDTP